jgi:hypothetical protein
MDCKKYFYKALCASFFCVLSLCADGSDSDSEGDELMKILPVQETVTCGFNPRNTSHEGANHKYVWATQYLEMVRLADSSYWHVNPDHQHLLPGWTQGDSIAILQAPAKWWGGNSIYPFILYNLKKDEFVEVKFAAEPEHTNCFRRYITEVSRESGDSCVILNDGSLWPLRESERKIWKDWKPGDVIIIGTNNTYLSWIYPPNILINIHNSSSYVAARKQK